VKDSRRVDVFVLLGYDFGANTWQRKHALGLIPGLNDRLAYGYYRAGGHGWSIAYSHDHDEGRVTRFARLALRKLLGFDLVHVCRNRRRLLETDIVWTHTELEHLGVLALLQFSRRRLRPKVIANCVWLFDRWPNLSHLRQFLYRAVLQRANLITTLSPENLTVARRLFPATRSEWVPWGALTDQMSPPKKRSIHGPIRIASLGNDMHRDWNTLLSAFGNIDRYELRVGSSRLSRKMLAGLRNVEFQARHTAEEVRRLYQWADLVVVPLKPNLHASGLTVVFESISCGVPVICTDTGGLRAYFSEDELTYVPLFSPAAMRTAVDQLAEDQDRRLALVANAQERILLADLTAQGFAIRNRRLSEELLRSDAELNGASCTDDLVQGTLGKVTELS
jgi:glycosyltransferase involved in cell wall biosynthesis